MSAGAGGAAGDNRPVSTVEDLRADAKEAAPPAPPPSRRAPGRRLEALVFVIGAGTLGAEIAGARLMAPFFGASTFIWANTIAVVLLALAVGYWVGGRLADRRPRPEALGRLALGGAAAIALVPFVAHPLLEVAVDAFDDIAVGAFVASLVAVLVLVAVPVAVLAAASPWAIRLALRSVQDAGRTTGRMYALSTAGSLLGTFVAALAAIPLIGTQRTFVAFAVAIALAALPLLPARALLAPAGMAALLAVPVGAIKSSGDGRVIHEAETTYQYARVVQEPDGERRLELNEGRGIHSVWRADTVLTDDVWDGYLVLPLAGLGRAPRRVAILGNGAGTTVRAYGRFFPRTRIDAVEIDGELTEIGKRFFGLRERPGLRLVTDDARPFLRSSPGGYDVIMVDAYRQPYIPFYLATREFFELARRRLAPGGVVVVNAAHPEGSDELEKVLAATMAEAFPTVLRDPIEDTNTLLVAGRGPTGPQRLRAAARTLPGELRPVALASAARLAPRLRGGRVYRDDLAPVEWLIDRSIVEYAAGGGD
jgi:spermidine synthase